ncbi:PREDICTED: uncharacterized protein LOC108972164 isoform X1 [Bactrocera latifrons]|uniref:uncharacterized protein LOC108972164 isoform X1 n=1 Tax=Bactrocera latifrons TaxID=174628 RepID=UPI0008DC9855|nr:PREDICTED: uncharacterized protein LOC108972164 isoform X1 [Bactrocera latifrons]
MGTAKRGVDFIKAISNIISKSTGFESTLKKSCFFQNGYGSEENDSGGERGQDEISPVIKANSRRTSTHVTIDSHNFGCLRTSINLNNNLSLEIHVTLNSHNFEYLRTSININNKEMALVANEAMTKYLLSSQQIVVAQARTSRLTVITSSIFEAVSTSTTTSASNLYPRIFLANRCYFGLRQLRSKVLSHQTKTKLYKSLIIPVLLYGVEARTLTIADTYHLLRCEFSAKDLWFFARWPQRISHSMERLAV